MKPVLGMTAPLIPSAPGFFSRVSTADKAKRPNAKPGDVINEGGDILSAHEDRAIPHGMVYVLADQVTEAERFGWSVHWTSAPKRNGGLVTICR